MKGTFSLAIAMKVVGGTVTSEMTMLWKKQVARCQRAPRLTHVGWYQQWLGKLVVILMNQLLTTTHCCCVTTEWSTAKAKTDSNTNELSTNESSGQGWTIVVMDIVSEN